MLPAPHPRGIGEILDLAAEILLARFARLVGIAFVTLAVVQGLFRSVGLLGQAGPGPDLEEAYSLLALSLAVFLISNAVINAVATRVTVRFLLGDLLPSGSLVRALPAVLAVSLVTMVLMVVGGIFTLGLGSLIVWYKFLFAPNVVVAESVGPLKAMRRSWELTRASFGRCAGVYLGGMLLVLPLSLAAQDIQDPAGYTMAMEWIPGLSPLAADVLLLLVGALLQALPAAYTGAAFAVLYADTLVRREGVDLVARLADRDLRLSEPPSPPQTVVEELV
jgi:hypothetical protein